MIDGTALNWSVLSESELEEIERALDCWESKEETRSTQPGDVLDQDLCPNPKLIPFVKERIDQLLQIEQFRIASTDVVCDLLSDAIEGVDISETISKRWSSTVYKGIQANPKRTVAVKVLDSFGSDVRRLRWFAREIRILAKLRHSGIAEVFLAGQSTIGDRQLPYFVMEFVNGPTITEYAARERLSISARIELFCSVCEAIEHAHHRGIIHRDLKPTNILTAEGQPKVLDFGISVSLDRSETEFSAACAGTPSYMSPEQFDTEQEQNIHTDIYSLGVILYELISGELPYPNPVTTIAQAARVICDGHIVELRKRVPSCSLDLASIAHKCLSLDAKDRYQSVTELKEDLQRFQSGQPVSARSMPLTERVGRTIQTHWAVASLSILTLLMIVAGSVSSLIFWQRERQIAAKLSSKVTELHQANEAVALTNEQLQTKLLENRRSQFNHVLSLVDQHWFDSPDLAREWLLSTDPRQQGSFAFRAQLRKTERVLDEIDAYDFPVISLHYDSQRSMLTSMSESGDVKSWAGDALVARWQRALGLRRGWSLAVRPGGEMVTVLCPEGLRSFCADRANPIAVAALDTPIAQIQYSADGQYLMGWGRSENIYLWDANLEPADNVFHSPFKRIIAATIDPVNQRLVAVGANGGVCVWDLQTNQPPVCWQMNLNTVGRVAFSHDGQWIAAANRFGNLKIYDSRTQRLVAHHPARGERMDRIAFSSDGQWLVYTSRQQVAGISVAEDWKRCWTHHAPKTITSLVMAGTSEYFLGFDSGIIKRYSISAPSIQTTICDELKFPQTMCIDANTTRAYIADQEPRVVDLKSAETVTRYSSNLEGQHFRATLHSDGIFDLVPHKGQTVLRALPGETQFSPLLSHDATVTAVVADPPRNRLLIGAATGSISMVDLQTGTPQQSIVAHQDRIVSIAVDPDSGRFATGCFRGEVAIWDQHGERLHHWTPHDKRVLDVAFAPDGSRLYSCSKDCTVGVFDLTMDRALPSIRPGVDPIRAIAISPDGQTLAIGGSNPDIVLCDALTGEYQARLTGHRDAVTSLHFSHDGKSLFSISLDNTLRSWTP